MNYISTSIPNGSFRYQLSLLFSSDAMSYGLFDYGNKLIKAKKVDKWQDQFNSDASFRLFIENEGINIENLRKVKIGVDNQDFTLVPDQLYSKAKDRLYLKNVTSASARKNSLRVDDLKEKKNVYFIDKEFIALAKKVFKDPEIFHLNTALLKTAESSYHSAVFANITKDSLQIIGVKNGVLNICQTYEAKSDLVRLYYMMLVYDQLKWNTKTVPLYLAGEVTQSSELFKLLRLYIQEINYASCPIRFPDPNDDQNPSKHHFYAFYSVLKCAS